MVLTTWYRRVGRTSLAPVRWAAAWARITFFGAVMVVRALSTRSYGPQTRYNLARHVYLDTAPILAGSRCSARCSRWSSRASSSKFQRGTACPNMRWRW